MNVQRWLIALLLSGAFTSTTLWAQPVEPPPEMPAAEEDLDILTRGPVHEAFAEQVNPNPEPGLTTDKEPPPDVNELPPDVKPEGDDVAWIPGYWFWDDDRKDYVWVSGLWRRIPPGRRWVPGYWQATGSGHQWVSGFWDSAAKDALEYVEPPPESLEVGPSSPAPTEEDFWIPGNWVLGETGYDWRPGFWHDYTEGWTWVCPRYVWTPGGCVYVSGYWDYPITRRGCLFAPVYYRRPLYLAANYFYRPSCWIGHNSLLMHLWVRPRCGHYYFGDYYATRYRGLNFYHCYDYFRRHRGFDGLYTYYRHYYRRRGVDYFDRVHKWHDYYGRNPEHRPAHTLADQRRRHHDAGRPGSAHGEIGRDWFREAGDRIGGRTTRRVGDGERGRLERASNQMRDIAKQRSRGESKRDFGEGLAKRGERSGGPGEGIRRPPVPLTPRTRGDSDRPPSRGVNPPATERGQRAGDTARRSIDSGNSNPRRFADRIALPKSIVESQSKPQSLSSTDRNRGRSGGQGVLRPDADRIARPFERTGRSASSSDAARGRTTPPTGASSRQFPGTRRGSERPSIPNVDRTTGSDARRTSPPARINSNSPSRSFDASPRSPSPTLRQQSPSPSRNAESTPRIRVPSSSRSVTRNYAPSFSTPRSYSPSRSSSSSRSFRGSTSPSRSFSSPSRGSASRSFGGSSRSSFGGSSRSSFGGSSRSFSGGGRSSGGGGRSSGGGGRSSGGGGRGR